MTTLEKILQEIEELSEEHPYKIQGKYETYSQYNEAWQDCISRVEGIIERNISEKNDGWIPCSERMPDKGEKVLCYFKYEPESPDVVCENVYIGSGIWQSETEKVVAWMKCPDDYRDEGGSEEKKKIIEKYIHDDYANEKRYLYEVNQSDIENLKPATKEFLDDCKKVAGKYKKKTSNNDAWILCNNCLPKERQEVWITTISGELRRGMYEENGDEIFLLSDGFLYKDSVIAWMPYVVPDPYKKAGE